MTYVHTKDKAKQVYFTLPALCDSRRRRRFSFSNRARLLPLIRDKFNRERESEMWRRTGGKTEREHVSSIDTSVVSFAIVYPHPLPSPLAAFRLALGNVFFLLFCRPSSPLADALHFLSWFCDRKRSKLEERGAKRKKIQISPPPCKLSPKEYRRSRNKLERCIILELKKQQKEKKTIFPTPTQPTTHSKHFVASPWMWMWR